MSTETISPAVSPLPAVKSRREVVGKILNVMLGRFGIIIALGILCAVLTIHSENALGRQVFLTDRNLLQIALQASINIIIAVGMTFVITTGGIDLSVGSIVAFAGIFVASIAKEADVEGANQFIKILGSLPGLLIIGVMIGAFCGLINGGLITLVRLPPFIVTLGTMSIFRGATMIFTEGRPIYGLPNQFINFFSGYVGQTETFRGIPIPAIIALIIALIFGFVLNRTRLGEYTVAIGGNAETARLSGVRVQRYTTLVYVICGALCGVAAVILTARVSAAEAIAGQGYELDAIAATVIGGTSLSGGEGTIFGTVIGGLLMSVVRNGFNLFNVQVYWQQVIIGLVIVLAVTLDRLKKQQ